MEKKIPMRTCIACRECKPKRELVRIVKSDDQIFLDRTGKANGRGAYVCDSIECFNKLKKGKMLNRAFSMEIGNETMDKLEVEFLGK